MTIPFLSGPTNSHPVTGAGQLFIQPIKNTALLGAMLFGVVLGLASAPQAQARSSHREAIPEAKALSYQPIRFGQYEVHYSAFKSTFISPETARIYHLTRDANHGVVNIAIRDVKDSEIGKAVTGKVQGERKNLMTQMKGLTFKEVKEGAAIYYLADFKFSDEELLKFTIEVTPTGSQTTETLRFEQTFYE